MQLGCNTVLFGAADLPAVLADLAWAGYRTVELAAIPGMAEHLRPDFTPAETVAIRQQLAAQGLTATAIEAARPARERLEPLFAIASALAIPIVNIGSGGVADDEDSFKQAVENIGQLAHLAGRVGVRLAVKPHVGQAIYNAATALQMLDAVREPALGLNFDPTHLFRANEEPDEVARRWGTRIIASHFRDCGSREQRIGSPEVQIPGRGAIDLPAALAALRDVGYAGPLNLEIIGATNYDRARQLGIAAASSGYLHRCLQELGLEASA
ncbi:MAG: sugar phosphate isomerase/epimerase family protein [Thermomicrobiales bacterium]